jgi:hypothetical protein
MDGDTLVPVFMIPTGYDDTPTPSADDEGPTGTPVDPSFRTMGQVVELRGLER